MQKKKGPPTKYTPALAEEICRRLAGGESLRSICRDKHMPSDFAVRDWVINDLNGFGSQYTRARDIGLDVMAEQVLEISDEEPGILNSGGKDSGDVAHKRLRFDARRWYLSKLAPKRYGDRQAVELSGAIEIREMSEEDMKAELAALFAQGIVVPGVESLADDVKPV